MHIYTLGAIFIVVSLLSIKGRFSVDCVCTTLSHLWEEDSMGQTNSNTAYGVGFQKIIPRDLSWLK